MPEKPNLRSNSHPVLLPSRPARAPFFQNRECNDRPTIWSLFSRTCCASHIDGNISRSASNKIPLFQCLQNVPLGNQSCASDSNDAAPATIRSSDVRAQPPRHCRVSTMTGPSTVTTRYDYGSASDLGGTFDPSSLPTTSKSPTRPRARRANFIYCRARSPGHQHAENRSRGPNP